MRARIARSLLSAGVVLALSACYHATIETGLPPSNQTLEKPWALAFVYGLVPPATIETAQRCPHGVAKVETQLSFLNQVVNALTFGILTPMDIRVTCAAQAPPGPRAEAAVIDAKLPMEHKQDLFTAAVWRAREVAGPVWVRFR